VRRLPTVSDVAEAARVSRQTVSNVLNTPEIVRPETRERVEVAIRSLGYRPHASARRLRTRVSATIGVRLDPGTDGMSGALLDRFLHSLVEQADAAGLRVLLYTAADEDAEIRTVERLLDGADVDAFVLTSTHYGDRRIPWLIEHDVRFVTFGRPWGEHDMTDRSHRWVDVDGNAGLRAATSSLLARGLRRIAFLGWPAGSGTGDDRRAGWRAAMTEAGVAPAVLDELDLAVEEDPHLAARLALGPDVPVVGYDDTPVARALGFSSVAQPLEGVAQAVLELLRSDEDPHHRLLAPALVER
jgi:DNA-binding LacI/PurR family transcriptional regulator